MKRKMITLAVLLALLALMLPEAVFISGESSEDGTFTGENVAPTVDSVALWTIGGGAASTDSMTPQVEYNIKVGVTDDNLLNDLTTVKVALFYSAGAPTYPDAPAALTVNADAAQKVVTVADTSGFVAGHNVLISDTSSNEYAVIDTIDSENHTMTMTENLAHAYTTANNATIMDMNDVPVTGAVQTAAVLTCTVGVPSWSITPTGGGTTWSEETGNCVQPDIDTLSTGTFEFHFKPGKVATAGTGKWYIYAIATDAANTTGDNNKVAANDMAFYSEIHSLTINEAGLTIDFGSMAPGTAAQEADKTVDVVYIANGNYKVQVKTDDGSSHAYWVNGSNHAILHTADLNPDAGDFVLEANNTNGHGTAVQVTDAYDGDIEHATGAITLEAGHEDTDTDFWVGLGSSGIPTGAYAGTIYFEISNR